MNFNYYIKSMLNKCKDCGLCCIDTEMMISDKDIKLIIKKASYKLKKNDFVIMNKNGFLQLKNVKRQCFFFDEKLKTCKIYEVRPQGCRFFPLIYDKEQEKCILDDECPRNLLFYHDQVEFNNSCKKLKKFIIEQLKIK